MGRDVLSCFIHHGGDLPLSCKTGPYYIVSKCSYRAPINSLKNGFAWVFDPQKGGEKLQPYTYGGGKVGGAHHEGPGAGEFRCHRIRCARSIRPLWIVCASPFQNSLVLNILPRPRSDGTVARWGIKHCGGVRKGGRTTRVTKSMRYYDFGNSDYSCYYILQFWFKGYFSNCGGLHSREINSQPTHHFGWLGRCNFTLCFLFI